MFLANYESYNHFFIMYRDYTCFLDTLSCQSEIRLYLILLEGFNTNEKL